MSALPLREVLMKGVILCGGLGSRLFPLTFATNKHLLPIFDKPMVYYPIQTLLKAGIDEIMIVTGGPHAGHFINVLKNGKQFGVKHLEYAYQEGEGGISVALSLAEDFADGQPLAVVLGDNTTDADISLAVKNFKKGATVFLKKVNDPKRFGVPVFDKKDQTKIIKIDEKPKHPKTDYAVIGLYIYDHQVFDIIRHCRPSKRGEMEITDVNNEYLRLNQLNWHEIKGFWSDAGTFDSLFRSGYYWAKKAGLEPNI